MSLQLFSKHLLSTQSLSKGLSVCGGFWVLGGGAQEVCHDNRQQHNTMWKHAIETCAGCYGSICSQRLLIRGSLEW